MLKSLSALGFYRYVVAFIKFLSEEIHNNRILPNCRIPLEEWEEMVIPDELKERTSIFLEHADQNSKEYQQFLSDLERYKFWLITHHVHDHVHGHVRDQSEEKIIDEFKDALLTANKKEIERQDESQMTQKNQASMEVLESASISLKGNTNEEKERAIDNYMRVIEKGRQQVNENREKAAKHLADMMAAKKGETIV